eukprot:31342-Pelagococcus_subviridis.AAC.9
MWTDQIYHSTTPRTPRTSRCRRRRPSRRPSRDHPHQTASSRTPPRVPTPTTRRRRWRRRTATRASETRATLAYIRDSFRSSSALVASSKNATEGCRRNKRANATRCCSPALRTSVHSSTASRPPSFANRLERRVRDDGLDFFGRGRGGVRVADFRREQQLRAQAPEGHVRRLREEQRVVPRRGDDVPGPGVPDPRDDAQER